MVLFSAHHLLTKINSFPPSISSFLLYCPCFSMKVLKAYEKSSVLKNLPILEGLGYNKQSVEKARLFLQVCVSVLGEASCLWIAFQSNVLYDLTYTYNEFSQSFKDMLEDMEREYGFYLPTLRSVNMRNSNEIVELSKAVKPEDDFYKIRNDVVEILSAQKSSVTSRKPRLIPIEKQNLKPQLKNVIKAAMDGKEINVFLYNDKNRTHFDPAEIRTSLLRSFFSARFPSSILPFDRIKYLGVSGIKGNITHCIIAGTAVKASSVGQEFGPPSTALGPRIMEVKIPLVTAS